jgi:hypothetical protein
VATGIGDISVSSLISAAKTAATSYNTYEDDYNADLFNDGAMTPQDLATYQSYLNGRISSLNAAGGAVNATKALALGQTLQTANRSYNSNAIQNETLAIYNGTQTPLDKINMIADLANKAAANGDINNWQTLTSMYDSETVAYNNSQATAASTAQSSYDTALTNDSKNFTLADAQLQESLSTHTNKLGSPDPNSVGVDGQSNYNPDYGKPFSATQYLNAYEQMSQAKLNFLTSASTDPNISAENQLTFQTELADFQNKLSTDSKLSPQSLTDLAHHDPNQFTQLVKDGNYTLQANPIVGQKDVKNADGTYSTIDIYQGNKTSTQIASELKGSTGHSTLNIQTADGPIQVELYRSDPTNADSQPYYVDPRTGAVVLYNTTDGTRSIAFGVTDPSQIAAYQQQNQSGVPGVQKLTANQSIAAGATKSASNPKIPGFGGGNNILDTALPKLGSETSKTKAGSDITAKLGGDIADTGGNVAVASKFKALAAQVLAKNQPLGVPATQPLPQAPRPTTPTPSTPNYNPTLQIYNQPATPGQQTANTVTDINKAAFGGQNLLGTGPQGPMI